MSSELQVHLIPALNDNYIFAIHDPESKETAVVDPAEASPVIKFLEEKGWTLTTILNTHHHADHIGGNEDLIGRYKCQVVAAQYDSHRIPNISVAVEDGSKVSVGEHVATVLHVPGHTLGHIAYWFAEDHALFCGDTLFAMGCGRLFEGTPEQMWKSLNRLMALPPETKVYCAHEYTQKNAGFALEVEPENFVLQEKQQRVIEARKQGIPTVPSSIREELETNPFLRPNSAEIRAKLNLIEASDVEVFARLREMRNQI